MNSLYFLKNIPSRELGEEKARNLLSMFSNLFKDEKQTVEVTCSVGVAFYPEDGRDFQSLTTVRILLYMRQKSGGKESIQAVSFTEKGQKRNRKSYSSLGAAIDSDQRTSGAPGDLVNYVFQILL